MRLAAAALLLAAAAALASAGEPAAAPSRPPDKGCAWMRLGDSNLGLELLYQKCDFGFRRIDFDSSAKKRVVYQVWRDSGSAESAEPVIWMYEKKADETIEAALTRQFISKLSRKTRPHCSIQKSFRDFLNEDKKLIRTVTTYQIVPDEKLAAQAAEEAQGGVPEPPCGERGASADGISYFEYHPEESTRRFAFVDAGQEEHPMFDERSLKFLPPSN